VRALTEPWPTNPGRRATVSESAEVRGRVGPGSGRVVGRVLQAWVLSMKGVVAPIPHLLNGSHNFLGSDTEES
jgi:hypothetical protein